MVAEPMTDAIRITAADHEPIRAAEAPATVKTSSHLHGLSRSTFTIAFTLPAYQQIWPVPSLPRIGWCSWLP